MSLSQWSRPRRRRWCSALAVAALALAPLATAATASAGTAQQSATNTSPQLWPKLAPFKTLTVSTLGAGATGDQNLLATTLEGAYNQLQGPNRLYVVWNGDDQTWLNEGVFGDVKLSALPSQSTPAGNLDTLLAAYGHAIKGAIVFNPSDPDTLNLATTMAGIDDAMVAEPSQVPLLQQYGIPVVYSFANTTFASQTDAYQWELTNLFAKTNPADLVMLNPGDYGALRDYIIATKSFVFYLTSTNATEKPLLNQIISSRPKTAPTLGYIPDEGPDVADISSLGHFLNASDFVENGSDFAAVPGVSHLTQPAPQPVRATKNTVYVSFLASEGDNAQYVEHHMFDVWTGHPDLGVVPEGWGMAPGMADFAPSMISWYYQHLPRNSELLAGPSGVGYATQMTGTDLRQFAAMSGAFMRRDSMSTVDFWENPSQIAAYAQSSGVPSISVNAPMAYMQAGQTAVVGQTSGYVDPASSLLSTIEQDALAQPTSDPVFLDPMVDAWNIDPQAVLAIAQAAASWGKTVGKNFVFLTPSELALTEKAYHQGSDSSLPRLNAQAVSGAALLKLPSAGQLQGYTVPTTSGQNLIANPSGQDGTTGWTDSNGTSTDTIGTLTAGTYQGGSDIEWNVPTTEPGQVWAHIYPAVSNGDTYQFSVKVAGSGQVFMDVYTGGQDLQSLAINLTSTYQTLTWTATIPANAPTGQTGNAPQLQVRQIGMAPVDVHIEDATVQLASCGSGTSCMPAMTRDSRTS